VHLVEIKAVADATSAIGIGLPAFIHHTLRGKTYKKTGVFDTSGRNDRQLSQKNWNET
jgi:hypothetical protein